MLVVAQILSAMQTQNGAERRAFKYVLTACCPFIILIGLENLSTAMLLCITILCMMIIGRVPMSQIGKLVGSVLIFICVVFAGVMIVGEDKENGGNKPENTLTENINEKEEAPGMAEKMFHRADTWKARIDKFIKLRRTRFPISGFLRLHLRHHHRGNGTVGCLLCGIPLHHSALQSRANRQPV